MHLHSIHLDLELNEIAWTTYWSPILDSLSAQCINPCREIRNQAFSSLQPSLLSPALTSDDHHEWTAIFGDVLFPLINRLLKPEVYQSDPRGMSDTRVLAATMLCKVFLHYLVMLSEWDGMLDLWLKILDIMDRLMNSGQGDHLVSFPLLGARFNILYAYTLVLGGIGAGESQKYSPRYGKREVPRTPRRGQEGRGTMESDVEEAGAVPARIPWRVVSPTTTKGSSRREVGRR